MRYLLSIILTIVCATNTQAQGFKVTPNAFKSGCSDFCPTFWKDSLIICSNQSIDKKQKDFTNMFVINGKISRPFEPKFISEFHDGPASFSADGNMICYSSNIATESNTSHNMFIGLFFSTYDSGQWSNPVPFEHNNIDYHVAHPSLSADGKTLYFSSTMPGGFGTSDIYMSTKTEKGWSKPINLGEKINTNGLEQFPYIHDSGRLYFASNTGETLGGLDIFYSDFINGKWTFPIAMPSPINSSADDFGIVFNQSQSGGHFNSSRKKGKDAIYDFQLIEPKLADCVNLKFTAKCITFFEDGPGKDENVSHLKLFWAIDGEIRGEGNSLKHCFDYPGSYAVKLLQQDSLRQNSMSEVAHYDYLVTTENLPHIEAKYTDSSKLWLELDASQTNLPTFSYSNMIWKVGDAWYTGSKIILHKDQINCTLNLLLVKDGDSKMENTKCFKSVVSDWID